MPKFLEQKLEAEAAKQGKTGRAAARYVYGAMNNMGAMHGNKETAKGAAMDRKHARDMKRGSSKPSYAEVVRARANNTQPHPIRNLKHYAHPKGGNKA